MTPLCHSSGPGLHGEETDLKGQRPARRVTSLGPAQCPREGACARGRSARPPLGLSCPRDAAEETCYGRRGRGCCTRGPCLPGPGVTPAGASPRRLRLCAGRVLAPGRAPDDLTAEAIETGLPQTVSVALWAWMPAPHGPHPVGGDAGGPCPARCAAGPGAGRGRPRCAVRRGPRSRLLPACSAHPRPPRVEGRRAQVSPTGRPRLAAGCLVTHIVTPCRRQRTRSPTVAHRAEESDVRLRERTRPAQPCGGHRVPSRRRPLPPPSRNPVSSAAAAGGRWLPQGRGWFHIAPSF